MAKNMAVLEKGLVINILWCSDWEEETETQKDLGDRPVSIGDRYQDGTWLRPDGTEVLTPLEAAEAHISSLRNDLYELDAEYRKGVNSL